MKPNKLPIQTAKEIMQETYDFEDIFSFNELSSLFSDLSYSPQSIHRFREKLLEEDFIAFKHKRNITTPPTSYYSLNPNYIERIKESPAKYTPNEAGILAQNIILKIGEKNVDKNHKLT